MLLLLPSLFGLAVASLNVWGPYSFSFRSFLASLTTTIVASVGIMPFLEMFLHNPTWTFFFLLYTFLMFSMYLVAAFRGVYIDTRLLVRKKEGFVVARRNWSGSAALAWFAGVLPARLRLAIQRCIREYQERKALTVRSEQVVLDEKREETDNPEKEKTEFVME